jgi:hypothetical protein
MEPESAGGAPHRRWIEAAHRASTADHLLSEVSFSLAGNNLNVDRVGLDDSGVTLEYRGKSVFVPWDELEPSKWQEGRGYVVLKAKKGTPARGGAWVLDRAMGRAVLEDPRWRFPEYSRTAIPEWLS